MYAATAGIGFVALAYEVLLTRISILYLGNSVSVFPLVLTGFLLGTGISAVAGTWLYGLLQRRTTSGYRLFGIAALAAGFFVLLTPYLLLTDWVLGAKHFARFADSGYRNPLPILGSDHSPNSSDRGAAAAGHPHAPPEGTGGANAGSRHVYTR